MAEKACGGGVMAEAFTATFTAAIGAVLGILAAVAVGLLAHSIFGVLIWFVEWVCDILEERYG